MPQKLTLNAVKSEFEDSGCKLLCRKYINSSTPMPYICNCGKRAMIRYSKFKSGQRCKDCGGSKCLTLEYIYDFFANHGCKLTTTTYKNAHQSLTYICKCGKHAKITWNDFQQGRRQCRDCGIEKMKLSQKLSFSEVKKCFADGGCKLLATSYGNSGTLMPYICKCGKQATIAWDNFKQGKRCWECGHRRTGLSKRMSIEYLQNFFTTRHCKLISTKYVKSQLVTEYRCDKGVLHSMKFNHFHRGERCSCRIIRRFTLNSVARYFMQQNCRLLAVEYTNTHMLMPYICECGSNHQISFSNFRKGKRCRLCGCKKQWQSRRRNEKILANIDVETLSTILNTRRKSLT